jgi:hypothetical protein
MKDIYKKASQVIVWLGDAYDATLGAEMLKKVSVTMDSNPTPEALESIY